MNLCMCTLTPLLPPPAPPPSSAQVFQRDELELIAELCQKHDLLCVSDEVYEWLVHDGTHTRTGEPTTLGTYNFVVKESCGLNLIACEWISLGRCKV